MSQDGCYDMFISHDAIWLTVAQAGRKPPLLAYISSCLPCNVTESGIPIWTGALVRTQDWFHWRRDGVVPDRPT